MPPAGLRRAFIAFHVTLGLAVFVLSVQTVLSALEPVRGHANHAVVLLAGVEALGAALFVLPRTIKLGGALLLLVFAVALFVHGVERELSLLTYAAGTIFVMVHGSGWEADVRRRHLASA